MPSLRLSRPGAAPHYEHAEYDGGLFINENGRIQARGNGYFTPGAIQSRLTRITCETCGHEWHPRRGFDGTVVVCGS
jgi:hypothetical protein